MRRLILFMLIISALSQSITLFGCDRPSEVRIPKKKDSETKKTTNKLRFGPVYSVQNVEDPVLSKTLENVQTTGETITGAEIRGYLADWVITKGRSTSIWELVVMKDGSLYRFDMMMRPAAAFGQKAPPRLTPESNQEAKAREAALNAAHRELVRKYPAYKSVRPVIYNYLVRVRCVDGINIDVWVDPDVDPRRLFYNVELQKFAN